MSAAMAKADTPAPSAGLEQVLIQGDLKSLTPAQRTEYYLRVCDSLGLNPLTRPFEYLTFQGRLVLYARRDCTEQLRRRDGISITIVNRRVEAGVYTVSARAKTADGREDESDGVVCIEGLKGESLANAFMKAETKAKRRVTLSICGLGMLDESEAGEIPGAAAVPVEVVPPQATPYTPAEQFGRMIDAAETLDQLRGVMAAVNAEAKAGRLASALIEQLGRRKDARKAALMAAPAPQTQPAVDPAAERADYTDMLAEELDIRGVSFEWLARRHGPEFGWDGRRTPYPASPSGLPTAVLKRLCELAAAEPREGGGS